MKFLEKAEHCNDVAIYIDVDDGHEEFKMDLFDDQFQHILIAVAYVVQEHCSNVFTSKDKTQATDFFKSNNRASDSDFLKMDDRCIVTLYCLCCAFDKLEWRGNGKEIKFSLEMQYSYTDKDVFKLHVRALDLSDAAARLMFKYYSKPMFQVDSKVVATRTRIKYRSAFLKPRVEAPEDFHVVGDGQTVEDIMEADREANPDQYEDWGDMEKQPVRARRKPSCQARNRKKREKKARVEQRALRIEQLRISWPKLEKWYKECKASLLQQLRESFGGFRNRCHILRPLNERAKGIQWALRIKQLKRSWPKFEKWCKESKRWNVHTAKVQRHKCPICLEFAEQFYVPDSTDKQTCGHRLCGNCVPRIQSHTCPTCRGGFTCWSQIF